MKSLVLALTIAIATLPSTPSVGAPTQGVTNNAITIVLYNDLGVSGDMTVPYKPSDDRATDYQTRFLVRTIKGLRMYFQNRYQTYSRLVRIQAVPGVGLTASCAARQVDADVVQAEWQPFAVVSFSDNIDCFVDRMATKYGVPTLGAFADAAPEVLAGGRGWSFMPDQRTEADLSAGFMCNKLYKDETGTAGAHARFTYDPLLLLKPRSFALLRPVNSQRGETKSQLADALIDSLNEMCPRAARPDWFDRVFKYDASGAGAGARELPGIIAQLKAERITTVACYCVPVQTELTVTSAQAAATAAGYFPEWYWDHTSRMDKPVWNQTYGVRAQRSIGTSYHALLPPFWDSDPGQAYHAEFPGTEPNTRWLWYVYHSFLTVYQGIQGAGTNLTHDTLAASLTSYSVRDLSDVSWPSGGFDDGGPGPETFIDTAVSWWWDPLGQAPGDPPGIGCIRLSRGGARSYATGWSYGDADVMSPNDPCTAGPHPFPPA